jgi:hypothetical protein
MIVDISITNEADVSLPFIWTDDGGTPIDITGCNMLMQVRSDAASSSVALELSTYNGAIVITSPAAGAFTVNFAYTKLLGMKVGVYAQSLIQIGPDSKRTPVWGGSLTLSDGPTRNRVGNP